MKVEVEGKREEAGDENEGEFKDDHGLSDGCQSFLGVDFCL